MSRMTAVAGIAGAALALVVLYKTIGPHLPRQGLLGGAAIGVVFGMAPGRRGHPGEIAWVALKRGLAVGTVTGLGFTFSKGADLGTAWAIGGTLGVFCGECAGAFARVASCRAVRPGGRT